MKKLKKCVEMLLVFSEKGVAGPRFTSPYCYYAEGIPVYSQSES
jgi:hypothetical protein